MRTLQQIHLAQEGKASDKWSLYLVEYDRLFQPYRDRPVRLLEIGVQNGGSLEVWAEYFVAAERLVGCDIEPACGALRYTDPRISIVVGDANLDDTEARILACSPALDLVIDDGSHQSSDIVRSFARYFPHVVDGGLFVAEDMHCSYWESFEGGLHEPLSAISFFKRLADVVSHEHWRTPDTRAQLVRSFGVEALNEEVLRHVHSVEFVNSMCVVRKALPSRNVLGPRRVVGREASVFPQVLQLDGALAPVAEATSDESVPFEVQLAEVSRAVAEREEQRAEWHAEAVRLATALEEAKARHYLDVHLMELSTSWKLTRPLRESARLATGSFQRVGRALYWRLPHAVRTPLVTWGYRNLGPLFAGLPEYEAWRRDGATSRLAHGHDGTMIDLDVTPPASHVTGGIAIQVHLYYHDLADELAGYLRNMPFAYDLFVSVASVEGERECLRAFAGLDRCGALVVEQVPNRGRDLAPLFCTFGKRLAEYEYVAHVHGKKSLYTKGATDGWREYLCEGLLGSEQRIRKIFTLLQDDCGLVYPQNSALVPYWANTWLGTREMGRRLCARLGVDAPHGYFDFPAGSMFWARVSALRPLFELGLSVADFADEAGQLDGTLAHCLERMLGVSVTKQRQRIGIIADTDHRSWSSWRLDHYTNRSRAHVLDQMASPTVKVIAFDVFDTLLVRPLLDPESVKRIVAARVDAATGALYLEHRAAAEHEAREAAGRDVGLAAIFAKLAARTGLSPEAVARLEREEEAVERASLSPRAEVIELYRHALTLEKPVVLASDMFLSRPFIESCLREHGIDGWAHFFLSNEVGSRKDTGALYEHVLKTYDIAAPQLMMIGDNERSDVQIPGDLRAATSHIMRPIELARGCPRWRQLLDGPEVHADVHAELTVGPVLLHSFSPAFLPRLDPSCLIEPTQRALGYCLVGPLLVSLAEWLREHTARDGVDRLYFLAREGRIMKRVYDAWTGGISGLAEVEYLVVSRRTVSVPMLRDLGGILGLAEAVYFSNTIENFLSARYGLALSDERWNELARQTKWTRSRKVEVHQKHIAPLVPLLEALQPDILAEAEREREALLVYLRRMRMTSPGRQAVVDIGYGATIQAHLNGLLERPVDGYYMMTDDRAEHVAEKHRVLTRGCFLEGVRHGDSAPAIDRHSFELEKLLSSDDPQVVRYELDEAGTPRAEHYALSDEERRYIDSRAQLHEGVMAYVNDALVIRRDLLPSFVPSREVARALYETFIAKASAREIDAMRQIVLDDHYCGRGLVR